MFRLLPLHDPAPDARHDEALINLAAQQGPHACIWEAPRGLVVPRTYQRFPLFVQACADFAANGYPVSVRQSGGGIVPQGPGIVNVSLAYAVQGKPLDHSDEAYLLICRIIAQALEEHGVDAHTQAVDGSFCDGRYNLAVGAGQEARKIAGTAQVWRRQTVGSAQEHIQVVLVHALILAGVDVSAVTLQANLFEQALGSDRRYNPERAVSLSELCAAGPDAYSLTASLKQSLARKITFI